MAKAIDVQHRAQAPQGESQLVRDLCAYFSKNTPHAGDEELRSFLIESLTNRIDSAIDKAAPPMKPFQESQQTSAPERAHEDNHNINTIVQEILNLTGNTQGYTRIRQLLPETGGINTNTLVFGLQSLLHTHNTTTEVQSTAPALAYLARALKGIDGVTIEDEDHGATLSYSAKVFKIDFNTADMTKVANQLIDVRNKLKGKQIIEDLTPKVDDAAKLLRQAQDLGIDVEANATDQKWRHHLDTLTTAFGLPARGRSGGGS